MEDFFKTLIEGAVHPSVCSLLGIRYIKREILTNLVRNDIALPWV